MVYKRCEDSSELDGIGDRVKLTAEVNDTWAINEPIVLIATLTEDGQPVSPPEGPELAGSAEIQAALDDESGLVECVMREEPPGSGRYVSDRMKAERIGSFDVRIQADGWTKGSGRYVRVLQKTINFVSVVAMRQDTWLVDLIKWIGNQYCEVRIRRIDKGRIVSTTASLTMARALRQVFEIPRERITLDSSEGSLYCQHVPNPQLNATSEIVKVGVDGSQQRLPDIPGVDLSELNALAVDGERRHLWIGTRKQLVLVHLDSLQVLRNEIATVSELAIDSISGGAWVTARFFSTPSEPHMLHRIAAAAGDDLHLPAVRPLTVTGGAPFQRSFLHPLRSGGVVFYGVYMGEPKFVRLDEQGKAEGTGSKLNFGAFEMGIHPISGAPWVVAATVQKLPELLELSPQLETNRIYSPAQLDGMERIWSVDVNAVGDVWVTGNDRVQDPVTGRWTFPGAVGTLVDGVLRRISIGAERMSLIRTFH